MVLVVVACGLIWVWGALGDLGLIVVLVYRLLSCVCVYGWVLPVLLGLFG